MVTTLQIIMTFDNKNLAAHQMNINTQHVTTYVNEVFVHKQIVSNNLNSKYYLGAKTSFLCS